MLCFVLLNSLWKVFSLSKTKPYTVQTAHVSLCSVEHTYSNRHTNPQTDTQKNLCVHTNQTHRDNLGKHGDILSLDKVYKEINGYSRCIFFL